MKNIYLIIISLIISNYLKSQSPNPLSLPEVKSPQASSFQKNGNIPVNTFTGSIDLNIPLTQLNISGHVINVNLTYDSSGFIPSKKTANVGINWSLIAGGRITRDLNGIPDEYIGKPRQQGNTFNNPYDVHGFIKGVKTTPSNNQNTYNLNNGTGSINYSQIGTDWVLGPKDNAYEGTPDVFNFNVMGLSGKFIMGNDGYVLVQSKDPNIRVDLSKMAFYSGKGFCKPPESIITIIDGYGNKYIFGGDLSKYEISYIHSDYDYGEGYQYFPVINSFSLSKIEFSDGNSIEFEYEQGTLDKEHNHYFCSRSALLNNVETNSVLVSIEAFYHDGFRSDDFKQCRKSVLGSECMHEISNNPSNGHSFSLVKKSILKKIKSSNGVIEFNYKDFGYPIKHYYSSYKYFNEWGIDNIKLADGNFINFVYNHPGGINKRPFLETIKMPVGEYKFEYYNTNVLPTYYTKGVDHWGFYNGIDNNTNLAPFDTYNENTGDYTLNNTSRDPNPSLANFALLKKIIYPTKGYSEFEYESNNYSQRVERNSSNNFLNALNKVSGIGGGSRIRTIRDYVENGKISSEKQYKYTSTLNGNESSGILMKWPRYYTFIKFNSSQVNQMFGLRTSSNLNRNTLDYYNVGYSKVFEIEKGNGYKEFDFSNYDTHPDLKSPDTENIKEFINHPYGNNIVPINLYKNYAGLDGVDRSVLRGLLLKESIFKENNLSTPIKVNEYEYTDNIDFNPRNNTDNNKYVTINSTSGFWVQGFRKFMNSSYIKKETTYDFTSSKNIVNSKEYLYNSPYHLQLTEIITKNSKNENLVSEYQYPQDLWSDYADRDIYGDMDLKNMVALPIFSRKKIDDKYLSETFNLYEKKQNKILLKKVYEKKGDEIQLPNFYDDFIIDEKNLIISYDSYDSYGNITQYSLANGIPVSIIWGYNNQYPVAKIEGVSLNDFYQTSYFSDILSNGDLDKSDEMYLREFYPDALITTYSYKPFVGVTKIVKPNGQTEYYMYDNVGRLSEIRNDKQETLKTFQYNYKP